MTINLEDIVRYGGPWASAVTTTVGVLAALYLARRRRFGVPRLRLRNITRSARGVGVQLVQFRVVNSGEAPLTITGLGWRLGFPFRRIFFEQIPGNIDGDHPIPVTLAPGHEGVFSVPTDTEDLWLPLVQAFGKGPMSLWIGSICGIVHLADGRQQIARLPKSFKGVLVDMHTLMNTPI